MTGFKRVSSVNELCVVDHPVMETAQYKSTIFNFIFISYFYGFYSSFFWGGFLFFSVLPLLLDNACLPDHFVP